ncbi:hypothetical protein OPV22_030441 [Ensete ventricosum]|uniref:Uncharacterized protein n=1 Tax=Ensete ventricosum TaxID=4639 RepID=A0AAV8QG80_ENSVE|nr:hypothetical protein OPV22_030441 [Ensete ventricosum]
MPPVAYASLNPNEATGVAFNMFMRANLIEWQIASMTMSRNLKTMTGCLPPVGSLSELMDAIFTDFLQNMHLQSPMTRML